jgi:hypothetical protein
MTEREWRFRTEEDDERTRLRHELADVVTPRPRESSGRCEYCGRLAFGRVCRNCRDLVQIDPNKGGSG